MFALLSIISFLLSSTFALSVQQSLWCAGNSAVGANSGNTPRLVNVGETPSFSSRLSTLSSSINNMYYPLQYYPEYVSYDLEKWTHQASAISQSFANATETIHANPSFPEEDRSRINSIVAIVIYENMAKLFQTILPLKEEFIKSGIRKDVVFFAAFEWYFKQKDFHDAILKAVGDKADDQLRKNAESVRENSLKVLKEYDVL